ncbi:hypothetical protein HBA55_34370 [Pseudomaricurvus alkylphenolicus]|uniref:hypothetical protein n=1 Tax=Pseudomaricurvus alkylphenolicus TaxID=1306991 RepID=UPI00142061F2|nr:hypothetical protein [Pseudomaricurvus alkylphenolicus]NIB44716.1 hypothetical protein [Pseudomaricurvus alkylphenolicus]
MKEITGNRCGHNPASLRLCDVAKRGRGGQAPVISTISSYLGQAAKFRNRLKTWQNMNGNGRGRRSEIREAMAAVMQFLIAKEFQLDSRRCAKKKDGYHQAIDAELIAIQISRSASWKGRPPMSVGRVRAVITEFKQCGYIELSHQQKRQLPNGLWQSSPKVIQFTKRFFLELGGRKLWRSIAKIGMDRAEKLLDRYRRLDEETASAMMAGYFKLTRIFSPRQAANRPPDRQPVPLI